MSCIPPKKYKERYINYMKNTVFDDKEFWRKISLNNEENITIPKNNLYCSQNLNNEINKINKKNKLNEDEKSEKSSEEKCIKSENINDNNININTEEFRIESDHRLNFNFNLKNLKNNKIFKNYEKK